MFTKRYMYEPERSSCLEILEQGFVKSFEEVFPLKKILKPAMHFLKEAEKCEREGDKEKSIEERLKAGDCLQEYEWLSKYFCKSGSKRSYQSLAQIEEKSGNLKKSLRLLKKAIKVSNDIVPIWNQILKVHQAMGPEYLNTEKRIRYFEDLLDFPDGSLESKSSGFRLLGRAMLHLNRPSDALQYFKQSLDLSKQCNDANGMCDSFLAMAESGVSQEDSEYALKLCRDLSLEHSLNQFVVVSSLRLGQLKTERGDYERARHFFELAYETAEEKSPEWMDLCSVMCGIGRAHVTVGSLVKTFDHTDSLKSILRWRRTCNGPFEN